MTLLHPFHIKPDSGDGTVGGQKKGEENTSAMKVVKFTVYFSYSAKPIDILDGELASRKNPQQR
jgi:hypothetical protein